MNRIYRLYDKTSKRYSDTFALCDKHKPDYKMREDTKLELVAQKSYVGSKCFKCDG